MILAFSNILFLATLGYLVDALTKLFALHHKARAYGLGHGVVAAVRRLCFFGWGSGDPLPPRR